MAKNYKVIKKGNIYTLEIEVSEAMKEGWKCQGGICHARGSFEDTYLQAMVKE